MKSYIVDTGLAKSYLLKGDQKLGHLLENCVFMELCRRKAKIDYLSTPSGIAVDFVAELAKGRRQVIQVSADVSDPSTLE